MHDVGLLKIAALQLQTANPDDIVKVAGIFARIKNWWRAFSSPIYKERVDKLKEQSAGIGGLLEVLQENINALQDAIRDSDVLSYERSLGVVRDYSLSLAHELAELQKAATEATNAIPEENKEIEEGSPEVEWITKEQRKDPRILARLKAQLPKELDKGLVPEDGQTARKVNQPISNFSWFSQFTPDNIFLTSVVVTSFVSTIIKLFTRDMPIEEAIKLVNDNKEEFLKSFKSTILSNGFIYSYEFPQNSDLIPNRPVNQMYIRMATYNVPFPNTKYIIDFPFFMLTDLMASGKRTKSLRLIATKNVKLSPLSGHEAPTKEQFDEAIPHKTPLQPQEVKASRIDLLRKLAYIDSRPGLDTTVASLAQRLIYEANKQGIPLTIASGYRSNEEQDALYEQGRVSDNKPIVTDAKGGSSWHNYGLAFDVAILVDGKPTWPNDPDLWKKIGAIGKSIGLGWGGDFRKPDLGHFEYHPGLTLNDVRAGGKLSPFATNEERLSGNETTKTATPSTPEQLKEILFSIDNTFSPEAAELFVKHVKFENGANLDHIFNNNIGNLIANKNWTGKLWRPEWFNPEPNADKMTLYLHEKMKRGAAPSGFRAYDSLEEGVAAYLKSLNEKFPTVNTALRAGDAATMAVAVRDSGYCPDCNPKTVAKAFGVDLHGYEQENGEWKGFDRQRPEPVAQETLAPSEQQQISEEYDTLMQQLVACGPLEKLVKKAILKERLPTTKILLAINNGSFAAKIRYANLLSTVLRGEIDAETSIYHNGSKVELECFATGTKEPVLKATQALADGVSNAFKADGIIVNASAYTDVKSSYDLLEQDVSDKCYRRFHLETMAQNKCKKCGVDTNETIDNGLCDHVQGTPVPDTPMGAGYKELAYGYPGMPS